MRAWRQRPSRYWLIRPSSSASGSWTRNGVAIGSHSSCWLNAIWLTQAQTAAAAIVSGIAQSAGRLAASTPVSTPKTSSSPAESAELAGRSVVSASRLANAVAMISTPERSMPSLPVNTL